MIRSRQSEKVAHAAEITATAQTVAAGQLRAFIDRILRLKEEQDTIGDGIKEVYAEAKGTGFDRTAMGALVTELRKKMKDGVAAFEERNTVLDLYRTAYEGGEQTPHTHADARTRENIEEFPPHDPRTGEIFDTNSSSSDPTSSPEKTDEPEAAIPTASGEITPDPRPLKADGGQPESLDAGGAKGDGTHTIVGQGGVKPVIEDAKSEQQNASASQDRNSPVSERGAAATISDAGIPAFLLKDRKPLRPHCLNPNLCAGSGSKHCHRCTKAMAESEAA